MRGGARMGAGRKPLGNPRRRLVLYVTADEQEALKAYLETLRGAGDAAGNEQNTVEPKSLEFSAVESKDEPTPTVAPATWILELEELNHGMPRGKWKFIADTLNRRLQYDAQLQPWTPESVKKAWYKLQKSRKPKA